MTDDARQRAEAFVREVEAAMSGVPRHRRASLTAGLADHLLEPGDDGRRLIDDRLDPASYAEELRALAPPEGDSRPGRRVASLVGAALLAVVLAAAWIGVAHPWRGKPAQTISVATPSVPAQTRVPDVRALSRADAVAALEAEGFVVISLEADPSGPNPLPAYLPRGTVLETDPFPGTLVNPGSEVVLWLNP